MKKPVIVASFAVTFLSSCPAFFGGRTARVVLSLEEGMTWVYSITSEQSRPQKITHYNLAPRELQGKTVTPRKWEVGGGDHFI